MTVALECLECLLARRWVTYCTYPYFSCAPRVNPNSMERSVVPDFGENREEIRGASFRRDKMHCAKCGRSCMKKRTWNVCFLTLDII
jgi:hypothetical protein